MSLRPERSIARRTLARAAALFARGGGPGLRVLTYHRVNDDHPKDRLTVRSSAFRAQMEALRGTGRPVLPLSRAVAALRGETALPAGAVVLTFDDGYEDNHQVALPILEGLGLPAVFFLATGFMDTPDTLDRYRGCCSRDGMLRWEQALDLRARGHELGGHGRTHVELGPLDAGRIAEEVEGCALDLAQRTGERPRLFCYPRGSENATVRRVVGEREFEAACTVYPGANEPGAPLLALRRTEISGDDDLADFEMKIRGGFDAWHALVQGARGRAPRP